MPGSYEIRLHVGAHKTATTHLQNVLDANKRKILEAGCIYLSRSFLRRVKLIEGVEDNHWNTPKASDRIQTIDQFLKIPPDYPKRILLSEENILGRSANLVLGLYPQARFQLLPWRTLADGDRMQVFVSLRDYAGVLPSAYCQALRDGHVLPPFEACKSSWMQARPSWIGLIETAVSLFGKPRVSVWTMEHYLKQPAEIIQTLSNMQLADVPMERPDNTRRLSVSAVRKIELLDRSLSPSARRHAVLDLSREDVDPEPFDPLSAQEKSVLSERYKKDIESIRRMGVRLMG